MCIEVLNSGSYQRNQHRNIVIPILVEIWFTVKNSLEERIIKLQSHGLIYIHFDS